MGDDEGKLDRTGAFDFDALLDEDAQPPDDAFANPAGVARGECDDEDAAAEDASCDIEATAQISDMGLEETLPGYGIPGFEGEEDGGG